MHVRGDDDIARLGTSFNQMADSLQRRSASSRSCRGCSAGSSPTSATSCAPRSPRCGWPPTCCTTRATSSTRRPHGRPSCSRASSTASRLLLTDLLEISRFDAGAAVLDLERRRPARRRSPGRRADTAARRARGSTVRRSSTGTGPCVGRGRRTPGRADRAQPGHQRDRVRRRARRRGDRRSPPTTTPPRLPCATTASVSSPAKTAMVFNRFWRADPARARTTRRHRSRPVDRGRGRARCTAGQLQAWGEPGDGALFRLTLPRRAGDRIRGTARCRWCPNATPPVAAPRSRPRRPSVDACPPAGRARDWGRSLLAASGASMPTAGRDARAASRPTTAAQSSTAARSGPGDSPTQVVTGFLMAMIAVPLSTYVAGSSSPRRRSRRGTRAGRPWSTSPARSTRARRGARDARRRRSTLDARGGWLGGAARRNGRRRPAAGRATAGSGGSPTRPDAVWCRRGTSTAGTPRSRSTSSTRPARSSYPNRSTSRGASSAPTTLVRACWQGRTAGLGDGDAHRLPAEHPARPVRCRSRPTGRPRCR